MKLLIIDDDAELCALLQEFLHREGFSVDSAHEGNSALAQALEGGYDLVVLDEINGAVGFGLVDVEQVLELINLKPETTELVLTGRNAHEKVIEAADLVTEMREVKHPYTKGVLAQRGIDY